MTSSISEIKKTVINSGWIIVRQIVSMIASLFIGALCARFLGPANYGLLGYSAAYINAMSVVAKMGLSMVVTYELVSKPEQTGELIGTAFIIRLIASSISVICVVLLVGIVERGDKTLIAISFLQALVYIFDSYEVFNWWYTVRLESKRVEIAIIVAIIACSGWRCLLLLTHASVVWFATSATITSAITLLIVLLQFFHDSLRPKLKYSFACCKHLLHESYHYIFTSFATVLFSSCDKLILKWELSTKEVGIYSAAVAIAAMWEFVPMAFINSTSKVIYEKASNKEEFEKRLQQLCIIVSVMSIGVGLLLLIFGKYAVLILYGKDYLPATTTINIFIWSTGFSVLGSVRSQWTIVHNVQKYGKYYMMISGIINVILDVILIRIFGMNGAAIATLLTQLFLTFLAPLFFKQTREWVGIFIGAYKNIPFFCKEWKRKLK